MTDQLDLDGGFGTPEKLAQWLITTCLAHGAHLYTALLVAGEFLSDPLIRERFEPGLLASMEAERQARVDADAAMRQRKHDAALRGAATRRARRADHG